MTGHWSYRNIGLVLDIVAQHNTVIDVLFSLIFFCKLAFGSPVARSKNELPLVQQPCTAFKPAHSVTPQPPHLHTELIEPVMHVHRHLPSHFECRLLVYITNTLLQKEKEKKQTGMMVEVRATVGDPRTMAIGRLVDDDDSCQSYERIVNAVHKKSTAVN